VDFGRPYGTYWRAGARLERALMVAGERTEAEGPMMATDETLYALLRACAELSSAQALVDQQPDRTTAPRDYAMGKVVGAFRAFEGAAKALKAPQVVTIRLSPVGYLKTPPLGDCN
jgi:hypothetical protein